MGIEIDKFLNSINGYVVKFQGYSYAFWGMPEGDLVHIYCARLVRADASEDWKSASAWYVGYALAVIKRIILNDEFFDISHQLLDYIFGDNANDVYLRMETVLHDIKKEFINQITHKYSNGFKYGEKGDRQTYELRATLRCYCEDSPKNRDIWKYIDLEQLKNATILEQEAYILSGGLDISDYIERCQSDSKAYALYAMSIYQEVSNRMEWLEKAGSKTSVALFREMWRGVQNHDVEALTYLVKNEQGCVVALCPGNNPFNDELTDKTNIWGQNLCLKFSKRNIKSLKSAMEADLIGKSKSNKELVIDIKDIIAIESYGSYLFIAPGTDVLY